MRAALLALAIVSLTGCSSFGEPKPNLTHTKWRMVAWHDSGAYLRDFAAASQRANKILDRQLRKLPPNAAIVFDIDETLLSNWQFLRENDFGITMAAFTPWAQASRDTTLEPMARVFAKARAYRIPIFLITGRPESLRDATIRNLNDAGYWGWTALYLRPSTDHNTSVVPFKSGIRKSLVEQGYAILLNVGDQHSDLEGGYARRKVKLPNPFYFLQ